MGHFLRRCQSHLVQYNASWILWGWRDSIKMPGQGFWFIATRKCRNQSPVTKNRGNREALGMLNDVRLIDVDRKTLWSSHCFAETCFVLLTFGPLNALFIGSWTQPGIISEADWSSGAADPHESWRHIGAPIEAGLTYVDIFYLIWCEVYTQYIPCIYIYTVAGAFKHVFKIKVSSYFRWYWWDDPPIANANIVRGIAAAMVALASWSNIKSPCHKWQPVGKT